VHVLGVLSETVGRYAVWWRGEEGEAGPWLHRDTLLIIIPDFHPSGHKHGDNTFSQRGGIFSHRGNAFLKGLCRKTDRIFYTVLAKISYSGERIMNISVVV
jgi:hypothetical protein